MMSIAFLPHHSPVKKAFLFLLIIVLAVSSCERPKWKDDPYLRKSYRTRTGNIQSYGDIAANPDTWSSLNIFEQIDIPQFFKDFRTKLDNRSQRGFWGALDVYVSMHMKDKPKGYTYSPSLTGLFLWLIAIFIIVIITTVLGIVVKYRKLRYGFR